MWQCFLCVDLTASTVAVSRREVRKRLFGASPDVDASPAAASSAAASSSNAAAEQPLETDDRCLSVEGLSVDNTSPLWSTSPTLANLMSCSVVAVVSGN